MSAAAEKIRIGPAGWSYRDWKGIVYPEGAGRAFDPLEYLAGYFDVVEINSSYYRPFPAAWAKRWIERVADNPRFRFTAKLWRRFTHERGEPPADEDVAAVREGLDALAEEGKLLAVLVQFPWSFRNEPEARAWLAAVVETFGDYPLVLEVRHASWDDPGALEWLEEKGVALAAIDQPLHEGSLGPVVRRTAPLAYFRFHGRNFAEWFAEGRPAWKRYDYLYAKEELEPWVEEIRDTAAERTATAVVAITNNHYQGQAIVNALQLKAWSGVGPVRVPPSLRERYPEALDGIGEDAPAGPEPEPPEQRDLFRGGA